MGSPERFDEGGLFKTANFVRVGLIVVGLLSAAILADALLRDEQVQSAPVVSISHYSEHLGRGGSVRNLLVDVMWNGENETVRIRNYRNYSDFYAWPRPNFICVRQRTGGLVPWKRFARLDDSYCKMSVHSRF